MRRHRDWRPTLGQHRAAQGHLRKQGVRKGDLFLVFGLFRTVDADLRWVGKPAYYIWGWMQIEDVVSVDDVVRNDTKGWRWAERHPHLAFPPEASNTLYVAADHLMLPGRRRVPGAGVFETAADQRRLTATHAKRPSDWELPIGFLPRGRTALSDHGDLDRWTRSGDRVELRSVAKGQEFVLDLADYPELLPWVASLLVPRRVARTSSSST
jgi:hypothetical protein